MVDWRRLDWRGVTPQPPAATPSAATRPGGPGSGGKLDDAERDWLNPSRRRTALLLGLAVVVAVIVSLLAYGWKRR